MYIQGDKQQILGNLDISGEWDKAYDTSQMWTNVVVIPEIGGYVTYAGKSYRILSTVTYQEKVDPSDITEKAEITTICRILRIDDEGDDLGEPSIEVRAGQLTLI